MLGTRTLSDDQTAIRRRFVEFFESDVYEAKYMRRLNAVLSQGQSRVAVDMADLYDFHPPDHGASLGLGVSRTPMVYVPLCELALRDIVLRLQPDFLKKDVRSQTMHVAFEGPIGKVRSPRALYARHLNTFVALEGIVVRQSAPRPRLVETVHYCATTNRFTRKEYRDQLAPLLDASHLPTVNVVPRTDAEGHPLRTELGLSTFFDSQCAVLQETPESSPMGQLPRSVELRFDDDLADAVKPGDRVVVAGIFAPYTGTDDQHTLTMVLVSSVVRCGVGWVNRSLSTNEAEDMRQYQKMHGAKTIDTLVSAVAPSIFGLYYEKLAALLLMVGGVERQAQNFRIRGDINVLFVGEPSTAKSQLLRFVLSAAPLALSTTGKGSSGVGLTAAVTTDEYSGERSLSAGAMVLADRGILCVDEFDKMSPQDRVSMHEAMEQQTVTVAKAGIHASLNARCSVLAAANPVYGYYSSRHSLAHNVGLPDSLLSRFDLVFVILDDRSAEHTRRVGQHILRNHRVAPPALAEANERTVLDLEPSGAAMTAAASRLSSALTATGGPSTDFLRRYVAFAKTIAPLLSEDVQRLIGKHYVQLRSEMSEHQDTMLVTARTLESLVRLSTAAARLRLSVLVEAVDVEVAMRLIRSSARAGPHGAPPNKVHRREDPLPSEAVSVADLLKILQRLRREGRSEATIAELVEAGTAAGMGNLTPAACQEILRRQHSDSFTLEPNDQNPAQGVVALN